MAPAVNIHRTPYSGRNFEYYSEDGFQAGKALGLMVSMNRIGNTFSGNSSALCIDLLRKEWGFEGAVITDMYDGAGWEEPDDCVTTGVDTWLSVPFAKTPAISEEALNSPTFQHAMREACRHILNAVSQTSVTPAEMSTDWFYHVALPIDIVVSGLVLCYAVFIIIQWRKNKKAK